MVRGLKEELAMPISITCQCGKSLKVKDEWAGKKAKCPTCGNTFVVPVPAMAAAPAGRSAAPARAAGAAAGWAPQRGRAVTGKPGLGSRFSLSPMIIVFIVA